MSDGRVKVLLVDDEASLRLPLKRYLQDNFGYLVDACADGQEALTLVRENPGTYDVALIDEVLLVDEALLTDRPLPDVADGIQLMQQIKACDPDVETVVFTGWGRESRQRAIQAGAFRYLEKPLDYDELAMVIRTAAQQVRLRTISREILAEKDPARVLDSIMVAACSLSLAKEAAIVLLDRANDKLQVHARTFEAERQWQRHFKGRNLSREIMRSGQVARVPDTREDERINPRMIEAGILSFLGLPIPGDEGNLGVLYVYAHEPGRFEEWGTVAVLQTLTGQAGLALSNAQAFHQMDTHARYMEALVRAGQGLTQATRTEDQLALAWDFVREQLQTSTFFVALYDRSRRVLRFPLAYDEGKPIPVPDKKAGEEWGICGHVIRSGEELVWHTDGEKQQHCRTLGIEPIRVGKKCDSCIYLPLRVGDQVIGVISIQSYRPYAFPPVLLDAFRALGSQLVVALENARLFAELAEAKEWQSALIQNAFDAVIAINRDQEVTVFNRRAEEMFGWPAHERLGKSVAQLHTDIGQAQEILEVVSRLGAVTDWEVELKHREGGYIPALLSATQIRDRDGIPIGQAGFIRDLRQARLLEERLRALIEVNKAITETRAPGLVLQLVIESAVAAFPAAHGGTIHLYDEQTGLLEVRANTYHYSPPAIEASQFRPGRGIAGWVFLHGQPTVMEDVREDKRHKTIDHPEVPVHKSMICVPLRVQRRVIGTLSLDNLETTGAFQTSDLGLLSTFADQAAIAIANAQLLHEAQESQAYLRSLYQASSALVSAQDPEQVLQDIVERARLTAKATWVSAILVDELGQAQRLVLTGFDREFDLDHLIRPEGLTRQVVSTGQAVVIENTDNVREQINPRMFQEGAGAALCLPLSLHGKQIGVMWIHYDRPRRFPAYEVEALQLYVNQSAIAYDNARRMRGLEQMRQAAEAMAGALEPPQVLHNIVETAVTVLQARSATLWSYDSVREQFIPEELAAYGIPAEERESLRRKEPKTGGTAYTVMERGWVGVTHVSDRRYDFLRPSTVRLLLGLGAKSFQGAVLRVGDEKLGVLYVNYDHPRSFTADDRTTLVTFAYHAALSVKRARLLDQVRKAKKAAEVVARVTVLGKRQESLQSVVRGAQEAVPCDAVVLYVYDQAADRLDYPPTMVGVDFPDRATRFAAVERDSIVYAMLRQPEAYLVETIAEDSPFRDTRFARDERIKSCAAIPLRLAGQTVGVMFVNYRAPHRFTSDELANIELLANQAAVAIRNAQLLHESRERARVLESLYKAAQAVTGSLSLPDVLMEIAEQAWRLAQPSGEKRGQLSHVAFKVGDSLLTWSAAYPRKHLETLRARVGDIDLEHTGGRIGISGRAVQTGRSQRVGDVLQDPDYIAYSPGTRSELAVPLLIGGQALGVINVEHPGQDAFDTDDERALEALAAQAAIAVQNATQYEELRRAKGLIGARTALAWMGMAASTWRHAIDKHALTVREQAELLAQDCQSLPHLPHKVRERLSTIARLATLILDRPITPPLGTEEGQEAVPLNALVRERAEQLWQNDPYRRATLRLDLALPDEVTTLASREWLRRAFDILIDNAVKAVSDCPTHDITVATRAAPGGGVQVLVSDTGPGIPQEIQAKIGLELIEKREDAKGLGMGLLIAQTILQTYGGEIRVGTTGPTGTTMVMGLPWAR